MVESLRRLGTAFLEYLDQRRKRWADKHPLLLSRLKKVYIVLAWLLLILAVLAWIFIPQAREALIQFLWSYYLLWQFWFLSRSKTFSWTPYARLFAVGAWIIAPLSALMIYSTHGLFVDGSVSIGEDWSSDIYGPIVEESVKLLPFFLLFLFTRRTQSFSLTDYMLTGAAVGVGFDFMEEVVRRWVTADSNNSLLGILARLATDTEQKWEIFTLFPGSFEDGEAISVGHGVWTGLITLAIGLAIQFRVKWGQKAYLLPVLVWCWATFDHGAWNAHNDSMPDFASFLYTLGVHGHLYKWTFVLAILIAIWIDFRDLNRVRDQLPSLPRETVLEPVTEFLTVCQSLFRGRKIWGHAMLLIRERRELGFSLLHESEAGKRETLRESVEKRAVFLAGAFATGIALLLLIGWPSINPDWTDAYFAGLLDRLSDWWQGLNGWEKAGIIVTTALAGGVLTLATGGGFLAGGFTALGAALTVQDILKNPEPMKKFLEDPMGIIQEWGRKLGKLPPQEAGAVILAVAADQILKRTPAGRLVDELADLIKNRTQRFARKWMPGSQVQEAGTGMRVDVNEPDYRQSSRDGSSGGGFGKEPVEKEIKPIELGHATTKDYRKTFFMHHPELKGEVVVHHAVEQKMLNRFPELCSWQEIHSYENLRGIPRELNPDLHLSTIRKEWNQFYKQFRGGPGPTKEQVLKKAAEIDIKLGKLFTPPK
ncbi:PrsW family glutamic-type intramembrane protease [Paludifilum halophilum]|uniref:PrsW family glutamic-type intramembrane protease n=1 Tax=Paludifilum halophilum TaxID=1642702 RepID=UPI00146BB68F|nr:PrsW family glutamic-type intramembrane protease [Paludifilum halophilum]